MSMSLIIVTARTGTIDRSGAVTSTAPWQSERAFQADTSPESGDLSHRNSSTRGQSAAEPLNPTGRALVLLAETFGPIAVLEGDEAELHIADSAIRQWNYGI